jgi:phage tail-like protein
MALQNKFIVLNKEEDYDKGVFDRCKVNDHGHLVQEEVFKLATYISPPIDSLEWDTWWSKIVVNIPEVNSTFIRLKVYTSNKAFHQHLYEGSYTIEERLSLLDQVMDPIEINYDRGLLNRLKGRYLWFVLQFKSNHQHLAVVEDIKIEFPVDSFIRYFPAIYAKNLDEQDFFFRFISIFQDIYMEIETAIDDKFLDYDPYTATRKELGKLVELINFQEVGSIEESRLRKLLASFDEIIKLKGTRLGIEKLTCTFLDRQCQVIESYKVFSGIQDKNKIHQLEADYCNDPYHFVIKVFDCKRVSQEQKKLYVKLMDQFVPAKTHYKVIFDTQEDTSKIELSTYSSQIPMKL